MALFAIAIFLSALLLFLVQPIVGKQILPWFGGSAAVWSTCLVFFQTALLAGYFYSHWLTKIRNLRNQAIVHFGLIAIALLLLPIIPDEHLKPDSGDRPMLRILWLLTATVGLPYILLSATSPLLQAWLVRRNPNARPYRLFALSNFASLLALIGYPLLVERLLTSRQQAVAWSFGFAVFAVAIGIVFSSTRQSTESVKTHVPIATLQASSGAFDYVVWIILAALGSCLLLGVTNHLTQNIPSFPLMWMLPLTIYLLTYIVAFNTKEGRPRWYPRWIDLPLTALALCAMALLLTTKKLDFKIGLHVAIFSMGLFIVCLYCHGELARRVPDARRLTSFYLALSIGGALGSILIGVAAPLTLSAYYELGFTLYAVAMVATWLTWRSLHWTWNIVAVGLCAAVLLSCIHTDVEFRKDVIAMTRNFYGVLRVRQYDAIHVEDSKRWLMHGAILHGDQSLDPIRRRTPTTYYDAGSGVGLALTLKGKTLSRPRRVGIVGLGAGTIAAYGRKGDVFRFYEIDAGVVDVAKRYFTYLSDSEADVQIALGDARLSMEREPPQQFDVLAIDAFSGDSIPIHLITREALAIYLKHVASTGIVAFHVSNRFLELHPVVQALAEDQGLQSAWIEETREDGTSISDWVLLCKDRRVLDDPIIADAAQLIPRRPEWRLWTDDFNSLVRALK